MVDKSKYMDYKILWKGDFITVISPEKYPYETILEKDSVWIIPIKENKIGIRQELCPPYLLKSTSNEDLYYTIISGGIEESEKPKEAAIRELREESGIIYKDPEFTLLFENLPIWKNSTTRSTCYIIEGDIQRETTPSGDGTEYEKKSKTIWLTLDELREVVKKSNIDVMVFFVITSLFSYLEKKMNEEEDNIKLTSLGNDLYQLGSEEIPLEEAQIKVLINSLGLSEERAREIIEKAQKEGSTIMSSKRESNKGVVVNLYEVDYSMPKDPNRETQELASHLDEYNDFVTQYIFPGKELSDIEVGTIDRDQKLKKKVSGMGSFSNETRWENKLRNV